MNSHTPSPQRREWTGYATLMLIVVFVGALAEALQVPQSLHEYLKKTEADISKEVPPADVPPISRLRVRPTEICAEWASENSSKQYRFVCSGAETFEVYEVINGQLNRIGSGRFTGGSISADVVSLTKNRRGYWQLVLSSDKTTLQGTWRGDDPREFGNLKFRKVA